MRTLQRWIIRSILYLSAISLLLATTLIFPHVLYKSSYGSGQYLAQIHVSEEAVTQIYNSTGNFPNTIYEINLFQYCEYSLITNTKLDNNTTDLPKNRFYPIPGSKFTQIFSPAARPASSIDMASYKCHWSFPAFHMVQIFGLPLSYSTDDVAGVHDNFLKHYLRLNKYSKMLPILLLCYFVLQGYMVWVCRLKLSRRPKLSLHTSNRLHLDDIFIFSCVASVLLLILILVIDSSRDQQLYQLVSEFYSTEKAPIFVFPKSATFNSILTLMTEFTLLSVPLSIVLRFC